MNSCRMKVYRNELKCMFAIYFSRLYLCMLSSSIRAILFAGASDKLKQQTAYAHVHNRR
jgi:hypothetical protein